MLNALRYVWNYYNIDNSIDKVSFWWFEQLTKLNTTIFFSLAPLKRHSGCYLGSEVNLSGDGRCFEEGLRERYHEHCEHL